MPGEARDSRRGPKPNPDRGTPSGFRITARTRFELQMASQFVGTASLQATIDQAVDEFLTRLRKEADGFEAALEAAEMHRQRMSHVHRLTDTHPDSS